MIPKEELCGKLIIMYALFFGAKGLKKRRE